MTAEECQSRLHAAGWSTGERAITTAAGVQYVVDGVNGENAVGPWLTRRPTPGCRPWSRRGRLGCCEGEPASQLVGHLPRLSP
jgi:hypothetical protein